MVRAVRWWLGEKGGGGGEGEERVKGWDSGRGAFVDPEGFPTGSHLEKKRWKSNMEVNSVRDLLAFEAVSWWKERVKGEREGGLRRGDGRKVGRSREELKIPSKREIARDPKSARVEEHGR